MSGNLKLPKLELPKFDGSVLQWQSFWECFEASVDNSDLPSVTKFTYLRSLLSKKAKDCVAGLALTAANYPSAVELLKKAVWEERSDSILPYPTAPVYSPGVIQQCS